MKKTIRDIDVAGKCVLVRVDYNVPLTDDLKIADDTRITATLPTIEYLLEHKAKVILCSHLGRPDGKIVNKYSLRPVLARLSKLLKKPVSFVEDIWDKSTEDLVRIMNEGDVMLLENLRFYKGEEANDEEFAKRLASFADIFVFDAFATAHRKHASTYGVAKLLPGVCGFLVEKELLMFNRLFSSIEHPFVAILGGAKIEDKIPVVENLIDKVDTILIGGGMAYTFVKAIGGNVGKSLIDDNQLELAKCILDKAKEKGVKIVLPVDNIGAKEFNDTSKSKQFSSAFFDEEYQGMDIGPKTRKEFKKIIKQAKTIVWNGPLGVYEYHKYRKGTNKVAKYIAKSNAFSLIGGGDSVAAIQSRGDAKKITHLSTGGGASLCLLQGKKLPCIEILQNE